MVPPPLPPPVPLSWAGTWSRPPDHPAQAALGAAVALLLLALLPGGPRWIGAVLDSWGVGNLARRRRFLFVTSFASAFLSLGYIAFYLRGGPRAADAATYWLQGRAMSHGTLAWTAGDPTMAFRARNLVFSPPDHLAGAFPPGYPALLALGFLLGAPMLVGPLLAAGLVVATWLLGHELAADAGETGAQAESIARTAVALSIVSAALRYYTADAIPDGAAALAVTMALVCALRARRSGDGTNEGKWFALSGVAIGAACAARPTSAIAIGAVVVVLALSAARPVRTAAWTCLGAVPGLILLLVANRAATGHAFLSPLVAALTGVPEPAAAATRGATAMAMARSAGMGLRSHLVDVANLEPLALLPLLLAAGRTKTRAALVPACVIAGGLLVYCEQAIAHAAQARLAGLAVDGTVRLGGSGALTEVLPLEHALVALAVVRAVPRAAARAAMSVLALALGGFALHASHDHERLATGGIGRPRFEPDSAREANVTHGLLFFDDDEGYQLASNPGAPASHAIVAARMRGDDHDRLLYDILGHPPSHRYVTGAAGATGPTLPNFAPPGAGETWRFEAEADLPPAWQRTRALALSGVVSQVDAPSCGPDARALALDPGVRSEVSITIELPVPRGAAAGGRRVWMVTPRTFERGGGGSATLTLVTTVSGETTGAGASNPGASPPLAQWKWSDSSRGPGARCTDLPPQPVELGGDRTHAWWILTAQDGPVGLDRTLLRPR